MVSNKAVVDVDRTECIQNDVSTSPATLNSIPNPQLSIKKPVAENAHPAQSSSLLNQRKYSVPEAATMIGVGETKFREIINAGQIAVLRVGGKILLMEEDLEKYLQANHVTVRAVENKQKGHLPPLPDEIKQSRHLRKAS
jgi:excisionase family DNA binding protein